MHILFHSNHERSSDLSSLPCSCLQVERLFSEFWTQYAGNSDNDTLADMSADTALGSIKAGAYRKITLDKVLTPNPRP